MQALACARLHLPSFKHHSLTRGILHLIVHEGPGSEVPLGDSSDGRGTAGQRGQKCGNLHLPVSVPVNLLCRQRLNQPSVTPVLCQLSCSCRGAKGKFTIANPLLTHLFMPLAPPESQLAWVLEYFLHPAVLQSSHAGEFFHYHFTCALLPLCSILLCMFCIHSVYIGH